MSPIKVTPDNCFPVDKTASVQVVATEFYRWLVERTPGAESGFWKPNDTYRVALLHPRLRSWLIFEGREPGDPGPYNKIYEELNGLIPTRDDPTLPEDIIQVLENITIEQVE
jgi:hypothetical protein